jgi:hypothetical protein
MKCIVEIENFEISLKAQVHEDRVICENSTVSRFLGTQSVSARRAKRRADRATQRWMRL